MRGWCGVLEEFVGALSGDCTCASEYFGFSFSGRLMFFVCVRIAAQEETGAQIDIDRDNNTVTIRGSNPDSVAQCKEKIEKIIEEANAARGGGDRTGEDGATEKKFKVDKGVIPALLGSGASVIQRIEADSGASVRIDRVRAVHCRGGTFSGVSQCLEPVVVAPTRHALLLYSARCSLPATLVNHAPCVLSRSLPCRTLSVAVPSVNLPCLTPSVAVYRL